jgi:hypothetical protein
MSCHKVMQEITEVIIVGLQTIAVVDVDGIQAHVIGHFNHELFNPSAVRILANA